MATENTTPTAAPAAPEPTFQPSHGAGDSGAGLSNMGKLFAAASAGLEAPGAAPAVEVPAPIVEAPLPPAENPDPLATPAVEATPAPTAEPVKESRSAKDFKLVKEQRDTNAKRAELAEAQAAEYKKQLATHEEKLKNAVPLDYEDVKKQNSELQTRMERIAVEQSDKFRTQFDGPMEDTLSRIKSELAGIEGVDADELVALVKDSSLKNRQERLNEMFTQLTPLQQSRVAARITSFESTQEARTKALADHKTYLTEAQKSEQAKRQTQDAQFAKVIDDTIVLATQHIPYFKKIEGDEAHNTRVDELSAAVRKNWVEPQSSEELAKLTLGGTLLPMVYSHAEALYAENQKLTKELAALKGATAKVQSGTGSGAPAPAKQSILDQFRAGAGATSE